MKYFKIELQFNINYIFIIFRDLYYKQKGKLDEAIKTYGKAIKINPQLKSLAQ